MSGFLFFIYFCLHFCLFGRIYREVENLQQHERKCEGEEKKTNTLLSVKDPPSFNNGNFSWNRLTGRPVVLGCTVPKNCFALKNVTCFLDIFDLPSSCISRQLFNNKYCLCYKQHMHMCVSEMKQNCISFSAWQILWI